MAECARLESGCAFTGTVGSNPTLSAIPFFALIFFDWAGEGAANNGWTRVERWVRSHAMS